MKHISAHSVALLALGLTALASQVTAQFASNAATAAQSLEQKVASVLPTPEEDRWLQIPWRADIMQARAEAERQNKPLFLWIMDGNPLACG